MFKILVKNLKLYGYHGVRDHEKKSGQYFLFNIQVFIEDSDYSDKDDLENTLSYSDVIKEIKKINKSNKFDLLETFSQNLAEHIIRMSGMIKEVIVRIEKPGPPIDETLDSVGVEYYLTSNDSGRNTTRVSGHLDQMGTGNSKTVDAYLSFGSNSGDKKSNLLKALRMLENNQDVNIESISSVYETEPMYAKDQESFYNIVIKISITGIMGPFEFLGSLKAIEYALGRKKGGKRYGPRSIDIDILYFGDQKIKSDILELPHPRIKERKFVLLPLSEIAPDIKINGTLIKTFLEEAKLTEKVKLVSSLKI